MERRLVQRGLNRLFLLPILLSVLYAGLLVWQLNRMLDANDWVRHTNRALTLSSEVQRHIQFQESALRGYEIVPIPLFLSQFQSEEGKVDSVFELLHIATIDNPQETHRLDTLMELYWRWQSVARHTLSHAVAAYRADSLTNIQDTSILTRTSIAESLRAGFHKMTAEENDLYTYRIGRFRQVTTWLLVIIGVASILLGTIVGYGARRQTKKFVDRFTDLIDETRENRDLLETTLLSIDDAVIVTDPDGKIQMMNARALELTGWTWQDAKSKQIKTVFHVVQESDRAITLNPSQIVQETKKTTRAKDRILLLSRTGVEFPIEEAAAPVCNAQNEILAIVIVFRDISDVRDNEREAERRATEFRALIENAPDVIIRFTRDLRIIYANPPIEHVFDLTPQAIIGRHFSEIGIAEELFMPWQRPVEEVFRTGREITAEIMHRSIRGPRTYHLRLVPELKESGDSGGGVQTVISIARDITELKNTERRLRESESRFRSIIENSPEAFFILRAVKAKQYDESGITDFTIEHINSPARALLPVSAGDLLGKRLTELLPIPRAQEQIEKYRRILESGISTTEEQRAESSPDNDARWFQMRYIPIGDLLGIMASEITDRIRTLHSLERSEERYRRLVEHASEAIFSTDQEGRFTYANPYVRELGGYGDSDITQYHFTDLVAPEHQERVKRHFYRQFLSKTPSSYIEAPFIRQSGDEQWLAVTATLDIVHNEVRGFDCIAMDISNRRDLERELEEAKSARNGKQT